MQILESLIAQISPAVVDILSKRFGLDPQVTQRGISKLLPMVLGALGKHASTPAGASELNLLTRNAEFPHDAAGFAGYTDDRTVAGPMEERVSSMLLGENSERVGSEMAHFSSLPMAAGVGLTGALGTLAIGHFQKIAGAADVTEAILPALPELTAMLPDTLRQMLEIPEPPTSSLIPYHPKTTVEAISRHTSKAPILPWVLPFGLITVFGAIALGMVPGVLPGDKGVNGVKHEAGHDSGKEEGHATESHGAEGHGTEEHSADGHTHAEGGVIDHGDHTHPATEGTVNADLPDGTSLTFPVGSVEEKLLNFVTDPAMVVDKTTWFTFERLQFDTGSAVLRDVSNEQLDNVAKILAAYPQVNIKIGGYTDNTGNAAINQKLSADRAAATMQALVDRGVVAARMESEGYGDQHPVASNENEEGRKQNRRIDMRVTAK